MCQTGWHRLGYPGGEFQPAGTLSTARVVRSGMQVLRGLCVLVLLWPAGQASLCRAAENQGGVSGEASQPAAAGVPANPHGERPAAPSGVTANSEPQHLPQPAANALPVFQQPRLRSSPLDLQAAAAIERRERLQMWLAEIAAYVYLFAFGATLGSFLNVVVYRMPRGMGLLKPASRCPWCQTPIRLSDNLPLFGWIKLRGRCRACRLPISPRYPLVEALCGILWMGLAMVELFSGGANIPGYTRPRHVGALWLMWQPHWPLLRLYVYHALLLYLLIGLALIAADGFRPPRRLWLIWLLVGIAAPMAWADLHPLLPARILGSWHAPDVARAAAGVLAGLFAGALAGGCLAPGWSERSQRGQLVLGMAGIGVYLGWQGVMGTALLVAVLTLVVRALSRRVSAARQVPSLMLAACGALVHVTCWGLLVEIPGWPGPASGPAALFGFAAVLGGSAAAARLLSGSQTAAAAPPASQGETGCAFHADLLGSYSEVAHQRSLDANSEGAAESHAPHANSPQAKRNA